LSAYSDWAMKRSIVSAEKMPANSSLSDSKPLFRCPRVITSTSSSRSWVTIDAPSGSVLTTPQRMGHSIDKCK
jgi:hypothetical protein